MMHYILLNENMFKVQLFIYLFFPSDCKVIFHPQVFWKLQIIITCTTSAAAQPVPKLLSLNKFTNTFM